MKKSFVIVLCILMLCMAGCRKKEPVWVEESRLSTESDISAFNSVEKTGYLIGKFYENPEENSSITFTAQEKTLIVIIGENENWFRCILDGRVGYVKKQDVTVGIEAAATGQEAKRSKTSSGEKVVDEAMLDVDMPDDSELIDFSKQLELEATAAPPSTIIPSIQEPETEEKVTDSAATRLLAGINSARQEKGASALSLDQSLCGEAAEHAAKMSLAGKVLTTNAKNHLDGQMMRSSGEMEQGKKLAKKKTALLSANRIGISVVSGSKAIYYCVVIG